MDAAEIENMSTEERLRTLEMIWNSLRKEEKLLEERIRGERASRAGDR